MMDTLLGVLLTVVGLTGLGIAVGWRMGFLAGQHSYLRVYREDAVQRDPRPDELAGNH